MLINLTGKQIHTLKKILPTVKLNAYDIQTYQEILKALDTEASVETPVKNNAKQKNIKPDTNYDTNYDVLMDDIPVQPIKKLKNLTPSTNIVRKSIINVDSNYSNNIVDKPMFSD